MRKPIHPKQFTKEPVKVYRHRQDISLSRVQHENLILLSDINELWEQSKQLISEVKIINGPFIIVKNYEPPAIVYEYEIVNKNYETEKKAWDEAVLKYENDMRAWKESLVKKDINKFDKEIVRAEHRLANLKAARDGLPIPYPNE